MVKVSITLPNNAQITFESEEPEVVHEIVGMVLRDLPRDLMQSGGAANGNGQQPTEPLQANGVVIVAENTPSLPELQHQEAFAESGPSDPVSSKAEQPTPNPPASKARNTAAEQDFVDFCLSANPMGDMRRVVVAAEGAGRFLGRESVDAGELGRLFDLAGWQIPHSFVQTLRNAARSKFRWLERVPGWSGQYTVTDPGPGHRPGRLIPSAHRQDRSTG